MYFVEASLISFFIGILTGIFGIGGGFLTTPALMLLLSIPGPIAVGTDVAMIFCTSSFGMYKRKGTQSVDSKLALTIGIASAVGVFGGLATLESLTKMPPIVIGGKEHVAVQLILLIFFVLLLAGIALWMFYDSVVRQKKELQKHTGLFHRFQVGPFSVFESLEEPQLAVIPVLLLGVAVGFLTGFLGIGGGVIMLPCLIYLVGQKAFNAAGTSLMIVWLSSTTAVAGHLTSGNIDWTLLCALIAGGLVGTNTGSRIGAKVPHSKMCLYFSFIVLAGALFVAYKIYSMI